MVPRVAGLCKVLVSELADTPGALVVTVYDTTTPASSRRCCRTAVTVRSVTVLPAGSTANNALVKSAWSWGESVTPEMVCVALTTTAEVGVNVVGIKVGTPGRGVGCKVVGEAKGEPVDAPVSVGAEEGSEGNTMTWVDRVASWIESADPVAATSRRPLTTPLLLLMNSVLGTVQAHVVCVASYAVVLHDMAPNRDAAKVAVDDKRRGGRRWG